MDKKHSSSIRFRIVLILAATLIIAPIMFLSSNPASSQAEVLLEHDRTAHADHVGATHAEHGIYSVDDVKIVKFEVDVVFVRATNHFDGPFGFDRADFKARVRIDDQIFESPVESNDDLIVPGWEFSHPVSVDLPGGTTSISLEIVDADNDEGEQLAAVTPAGDRSMVFTVNAANCIAGLPGSFSGTISGQCGVPISTNGAAPNNTANIIFRIRAELAESTPNLMVRCLHEPIWAQPGEIVTVKAEALDTTPVLLTADELEVWVEDTMAPVQTCTNANNCSTTVTAPDDGEFISYRCIVRKDGETVNSGWRGAGAGSSAWGRSIPLVLTGPRNSRHDIVFIADQASYTGSTDPLFIDAAYRAIRDAYYAGNIAGTGGDAAYGDRLFLANQNKFNFWLALDTGTAPGFPNNPCVQAPSNWSSDYVFADSGSIIHTTGVRSCARRDQRIFSAPSVGPSVIRHETGHSPFGLMDEYCCDSSYSEPQTFPNIYSSMENCLADIIDLQVYDLIIGDTPRPASSCRQISDGTNTVNFYTSEAAIGDLMRDNGELNGADVRRIEWALKQCPGDGCTSASGGSPDDSIPEFDTDSNDKVVVVDLGFNGRRLVFNARNSPRVQYGVAPAHYGAAPMLLVELFDTTGQRIDHFNAWHPLVQSGSLIFHDLSVEHDPDIWLAQGIGSLILPFSPDLATMRLTDQELGLELITVDLLPAMEVFCDENGVDEDCDLVGRRLYRVFLPGITR